MATLDSGCGLADLLPIQGSANPSKDLARPRRTFPRTLESKRAEAALLRRKLELKTKFGLCFYQPYGKQAAFHAAAARWRMFRAGNRTGKSTCGAAEDCAWLLGERPWLPLSDPLRHANIPQRPNKGLVITTDWDKTSEIWTGLEGKGGKIWQFLPKGFVKKTKRNHSGAIELIECENKSILRFDTVESFKKNPMGSESSDWDFIHIDEPCPELQWKAVSRGLIDRGGFAWFTLTPLSEMWINDMFFPREGSPRSTVWAVAANTYDNPFLSKSDVAEFEGSLTEDERTCRIQGLPLELCGLVYKSFSYDRHVLKSLPVGWKDYNTPPPSYILYVNIDPHPQTNHAVLITAVAPTGQKFICREIWTPVRPISHLAGAVLRMTAGYTLGRCECDPLAWIPHPVSDRTMADEFIANGLVVTKASKAKECGILKMSQEFSKPDNLYVSPNLSRFLFEINRYVYDKENKPIDKDDHMMECMYRTFINDPVWFDPQKVSFEVPEEVIDHANLDLQEVDISQ